MITRGLRNNNPFNIKISNNRWKGKVCRKDNTDGTFEQFVSIKYGLRAGIRLLINYNLKYGITEIRDYIKRFAPNIENPTKMYINFVCNYLRNNGYFAFDTSVVKPFSDEFWLMCQAIIMYESCFSVSVNDLKFAYGFD